MVQVEVVHYKHGMNLKEIPSRVGWIIRFDIFASFLPDSVTAGR